MHVPTHTYIYTQRQLFDFHFISRVREYMCVCMNMACEGVCVCVFVRVYVCAYSNTLLLHVFLLLLSILCNCIFLLVCNVM